MPQSISDAVKLRRWSATNAPAGSTARLLKRARVDEVITALRELCRRTKTRTHLNYFLKNRHVPQRRRLSQLRNGDLRSARGITAGTDTGAAVTYCTDLRPRDSVPALYGRAAPRLRRAFPRARILVRLERSRPRDG